jgi:hypothetical protein
MSPIEEGGDVVPKSIKIKTVSFTEDVLIWTVAVNSTLSVPLDFV